MSLSKELATELLLIPNVVSVASDNKDGIVVYAKANLVDGDQDAVCEGVQAIIPDGVSFTIKEYRET